MGSYRNCNSRYNLTFILMNCWWQDAYESQMHWSWDPDRVRANAKGKREQIYMDEYSWMKLMRDIRRLKTTE